MRALSAVELLDAWEQGVGQTPVQQALALLAPACPDRSPDALARLSIGQRDACLLALREWTFGPSLPSLVTCPACDERLELTLDIADIQSSSLSQEEDEGEGRTDPLSLTLDGYEVRFRLPNSLDLQAIAGYGDVESARQALLQRCLLSARHRDGEVAAERLPAVIMEGMVETMAREDPQADVVLDLSCPLCDHCWEAIFDVVSFFWGELDAWARRALREVHHLASTYGWREAEILALSPWRRQFYLEMIDR